MHLPKIVAKIYSCFPASALAFPDFPPQKQLLPHGSESRGIEGEARLACPNPPNPQKPPCDSPPPIY